MPIEFNCRICNAAIRVPDKAAGGKGKCPKCGVRITVPKKSAVKPVDQKPEPEVPFEFPVVAAESTPELESSSGTDPDEVVVLQTAQFQPEDLLAPPPDEFSLDRPMEPGRTTATPRRLKQKKKNNTAVIIGTIAALAVLAGIGILVVPLLTAESLKGELTAKTAQTVELPPVLIDRSTIKFSAEELTVLLKKLEASPIPVTSNSMQITLAGTPKGLQVSVSAGSQSHYYRVSFQGNQSVEKYLSRHLSVFEEQREREVNDSVVKFFSEYQNIIAKKSTSDRITPFRDQLALPSLVSGLGNKLVAEYGRGQYRCVYEDRSGGLYFLLPANISEFVIVGRPGTDGQPMVPFHFQAKVDGEIVPLKTPEEKPPSKAADETKSKTADEKAKMDDDEMDGKK
jgi:hypothetical protein